MTTQEELGIIVKLVDQASGKAGQISRSLGGLGQAAGRVERSFGHLRGASQRLNAVFQGMGIGIGIGSFYALERAIGSVVRIIPDLIGKGEEWAKVVDDIADKTGVTAEQASALAAAAKYVNVSTDSLTTGLVRLSRYVIDNEQRFTRFGIATRDTNGNLLSAYDILNNVRRAITGTGAAMLSTAAAQDLLGRGGADLADMLQLTDAQFNAITADARQAGLIMSQAARQAAEEWERTKTRLGSTITGLGAQILGGVAPYLSQLVDGIANTIRANMDQIVQFAVQVVNFIGGLVAGLFGVTIPTVTFAHALGNVGHSATDAADGLSNLNDQAGRTATGEDRLTRSLNRQIDAIDRQLKLMSKRDQAEDAAEQRQDILDDLATAQAALADVQEATIFAANMTEAERVLAEQKHAQDVIDAQQDVSDAQKRLANHDQDEQQRRRREALQSERDALRDRLAAHRKFVAGLRDIYKPIRMPSFLGGVSDDDRGGGLAGGGLTGAITQAAADARAAGALMAQNVRDFGAKVGEFVTWAGQVIQAMNQRPFGEGTPSILELALGTVAFKALGGFGLLRSLLGLGGAGAAAVTGAAAAAGGGGLTATLMRMLGLAAPAAGLAAIPFLVSGDTAPGQNGVGQNQPPNSHWDPVTRKWVPNAQRDDYFDRHKPPQRDDYFDRHPFVPPPTEQGVADQQLTALEQIATSVGPGGAFFQNMYNSLGVQQEAATNTADAAANTASTSDRLASGINTSVTNTPTVNAATGFTIKGITTKVDISNPALSALRFKNGKLSTTTLTGTQPPGCFVAGTMVSTLAGEIAIEAIAIGDAVLAVDVENGLEVVPSIVTAVHKHSAHAERRVRVTLADGRVITATEGHRFFNPVRGDFYPLATFEPGFLVHDAELGAVEIASMKWLTGKADVYNLTVAIHQNYLVEGVLVHNIKPTYAQGGAGLTSGAMDMTIGEAGREAYAILRNPRPLPGGGVAAGGSGTGVMNVTLVLPGVGPIARAVLDWADLNASRSSTLRMVPGGSY